VTGRPRLPVAVLGVALVLTCWPVWWLAGLLAGWIGLDDLDLVLRIVAIFAFLTFVEALSGRLSEV
jgi:hypothetical protein